MVLIQKRFWKSRRGEVINRLLRIHESSRGVILIFRAPNFHQKLAGVRKIPTVEEEYPSLSVYWKIRLLTTT